MSIQDDLTGVLSDITGALSALQSGIGDTATYVQSLESQIEAFKSQVSQLKSEVASLQQELSVKNPNVVDPAVVTSVSNAVDELVQAIGGIAHKIVAGAAPEPAPEPPAPAPAPTPEVVAPAPAPEPVVAPDGGQSPASRPINISKFGAPVPAGTLPAGVDVIEVVPGVYPVKVKDGAEATIAGKLPPGTLVSPLK